MGQSKCERNSFEVGLARHKEEKEEERHVQAALSAAMTTRSSNCFPIDIHNN